jgi:electron transport complex protein RnfB
MTALLAATILTALPQTQCTRCGYPDCAAYAQAIAQGMAGINQCPPGGAQGIELLASITGQPVVSLNPIHGAEGPRTIAFIDENWCIGCTLCIKACPTDAIMGSNKLMHTVVEAYCTGCELCLPVCPVDCIELENVTGAATGWAAWSRPQADQARDRYKFHSFKRNRDEGENDKRLEEKALMKLADLSHHSQHTDLAVLDKKRSVIEAALARSRAKRDAATNVSQTNPD